MRPLRPQGGRQRRDLACPPTRVPFFPGRGHPLVAPPVRIFYSSRVRAAACFWQHMGASRQVMSWVRHGVKFDWQQGPPRPFARPPRMVAEQDLDFCLLKLEEGVRTGAHGLLRPGDSKWLAPAHVVTAAEKQRLVIDYRQLNDACKQATCRYESIDDLVKLVTPSSWLLSCDLTAAYHHCRIAPAHRKYAGFHLALPLCARDSRPIPLQHGGYFVFACDLRSHPAAWNPTGLAAQAPCLAASLAPSAPHALACPCGAGCAPLYQVVELCSFALSFGARASPLVFTKHMRALVKFLRQHAIAVVIYLDDLAFVVEGSRAAALRARDFVDRTLQQAGLTRHPTKGQFGEPSQVLHDHLGYEVNLPCNLLRVPERRCAKIRSLALALLREARRHQRLVPTQLLQQFTGTACSTSRAVRCARFHLRSLYDCTHLACAHSRLSRPALHDLQFWADFTFECADNGVPIWASATSRALYTDASGSVGWGGVLPPEAEQRRLCLAFDQQPHLDAGQLHEVAGLPCPLHLLQTSQQCSAAWDAELLPLHINFKELRAVHNALRYWRADLRGHRVLLFVDNMTVMHLLRSGSSRSPLLMAELRQVWALLRAERIDLQVVHIATGLNPADRPSRRWHRDAWTFREGCRRQLRAIAPRPFSLDPFGTAQASPMAPSSCVLHTGGQGMAVDGFSVSWKRQSLFLNPPWSALGRVLLKIQEDRAQGVLVIPVWPSQAWWPLALRLRARWVYLPPPRACVLPLHGGPVEPFAHFTTRMVALVFDATRGWRAGTRTSPMPS